MLTSEDIILRREDYLKLVRSQEEAQRIISDRRYEEEWHRAITQKAHGFAIFITRDGLEAMGVLPAGWTPEMPVQRPCRTENRFISDDEPVYKPMETRTYEFRGRRVCGKPVLEERG